MTTDASEGWDAVAERFMAARSVIGADRVCAWARRTLPSQAKVLDIGCGSGVPISQALIEADFRVYGIDASPRLATAFARRFPDAPIACEAAQTSRFFGLTFDAAVAVGLIFLLNEKDQGTLIQAVSRALTPGGHWLFSAPQEDCEWDDVLTGRRSRSLGQDTYGELLGEAGLDLIGSDIDQGGNHYYHARKRMV